MTESEIIGFAADVGLNLLENGSETQRVEDTIERIIKHWTNSKAEVTSVLTGITVSVGTISKTVSVRTRAINLNKISEINQLSRDITENGLSFEDAKERLKKIQVQNGYSVLLKTIAVGVCCAFFTLIFGGGAMDSINGFLTGIILNLVNTQMTKHKIPSFLVTLVGGLAVAFSALVINKLKIGSNVDSVIIGSIMPLVPGMGITNALRDLSYGDYISGSARFFESLTTALAVGAGAGGMVQIWRFFVG